MRVIGEVYGKPIDKRVPYSPDKQRPKNGSQDLRIPNPPPLNQNNNPNGSIFNK